MIMMMVTMMVMIKYSMDLIDSVASAVKEGWGGRRERHGLIWPPNFGFDLRVLGGGGIDETCTRMRPLGNPNGFRSGMAFREGPRVAYGDLRRKGVRE